MSSSCLVLLTFIITAALCANKADKTLEFAQIIFRHGEKTIDPITSYASDPHRNETFYPYGLNELTMTGKRTMYSLGTKFRTRYDSFLGEGYFPDMVKGVASYYNRTKVALELVFAGLFPPTQDEVFEPGLNWQPIPFFYVPKERDEIFTPMVSCPNFQKYHQPYTQTPKYREELARDRNIFEYISSNSGQAYRNYFDLWFFHSCVKAEYDYGLQLPDWVLEIYPEPLTNLTAKMYKITTADPQIAKLTSGFLLKEIINNARNKLSVFGNLKLMLYSAHDSTIATFLQVLGVYNSTLPSYGAAIFIELHRIDVVRGFKIYYQNAVNDEIRQLILPGCGDFCPFKDFVKMTQHLMPGDEDCRPKSQKSSGNRLEFYIPIIPVVFIKFKVFS